MHATTRFTRGCTTTGFPHGGTTATGFPHGGTMATGFPTVHDDDRLPPPGNDDRPPPRGTTTGFLQRVVLQPHHMASTRAVHRRGAEVLRPAQLTIARYPGDAGVHLLYLGPAGDELTDTFHDDVDGALAQAEFEFGVTRAEWSALN